jgi:hypothetical protein
LRRSVDDNAWDEESDEVWEISAYLGDTLSSSSSSISRFEDEDRYAEDEDDYDVSTRFPFRSVKRDEGDRKTASGCSGDQ